MGLMVDTSPERRPMSQETAAIADEVFLLWLVKDANRDGMGDVIQFDCL
jgi:hypothetical protein